jgi:CheY-like chemotaxis protein
MERKTVVAIFEDDPVDIFLYKKLYAPMMDKVDCLYFETLQDGLSMAEHMKFDVVIIDIHFWGNNMGIAILKKLYEICSEDLIAIAVTPFLQKGDLELIMSSGFTLCVEKPVIPQKIGLWSTKTADKTKNSR